LTGANTELTVKTVGNLSTAEEFNNIIIRSEGGKNVRLSDIGSAVGPENIETKLSQSGLPLIGLAIVPRRANYLDISKSFYEQFEALKRPSKDIKLNIALDNTIFVKKSVLEVAETLGISIFLVILIIYLFF
jgi:HAE1 family hydrophobic/amphiphilic exporter-1/multidrug efflux pump